MSTRSNSGAMFMELNPYAEAHAAAVQCAKQLRERVQQLSDELRWFSEFDLAAAHDALRSSRRKVVKLSEDADALSPELGRLGAKERNVKKKAGTLLNPLNWLSQKQMAIRGNVRQLREQTARVKRKKHSLKTERAAVQLSAATLAGEIERHKAFDVQRTKKDLRTTKGELAKADAEVKRIAALKKQVDVALAPLLRKLRALESSKEAVEARLDIARSHDERLSSAANSYERAQIHGECERALGKGRPGAVMAQLRKELRQIDHDYSKLLRRAQDVALRAGRSISTIIIDGNNLCYEDGSFIGLSAIEAVLPLLAAKYKVVAVFDSAIRRILQFGDSEIKQQLKKHSGVHVVASKEVADETVLELASSDETSFVISNDRYSDYPDKDAVRRGRILRHEIVDGRVFVHDLQISAAFR